MRILTLLLLLLITSCAKHTEEEILEQFSRIDLAISGDTTFTVHLEGNNLIETYNNHIALRTPEPLLITIYGNTSGYFSVYPPSELDDKSVFFTCRYMKYTSFQTQSIQVNALYLSELSRIKELKLEDYDGRCIEINGTFYYGENDRKINTNRITW